MKNPIPPFAQCTNLHRIVQPWPWAERGVLGGGAGRGGEGGPPNPLWRIHPGVGGGGSHSH